jgi:hypothetical protein
MAKDEGKEDSQEGVESASKRAGEELDDEKAKLMIWIIIAAAGVVPSFGLLPVSFSV